MYTQILESQIEFQIEFIPAHSKLHESPDVRF